MWRSRGSRGVHTWRQYFVRQNVKPRNTTKIAMIKIVFIRDGKKVSHTVFVQALPQKSLMLLSSPREVATVVVGAMVVTGCVSNTEGGIDICTTPCSFILLRYASERSNGSFQGYKCGASTHLAMFDVFWPGENIKIERDERHWR